MPNLNKVMLMGNLTRDPELRYLPSNTAVANLGLAINRRWRNQQGEQQEETSFIDCEAFGRQAEVLNQYLRKGRPVFIEGRLKLDQWQDREGQNRSKLKVVIESFEFIDNRGAGEGGDGGGGGRGYQSNQGGPGNQGGGRGPSQSAPSSPPSGPTHHPVEEDDIPF